MTIKPPIPSLLEAKDEFRHELRPNGCQTLVLQSIRQFRVSTPRAPSLSQLRLFHVSFVSGNLFLRLARCWREPIHHTIRCMLFRVARNETHAFQLPPKTLLVPWRV